MTKIQRSIIAAVMKAGAHLTADQVLAMVKREHPSASLSTVYRNLNMFAGMGQIRRIQRATGPDYYERNLEAHDHAYCVKCNDMLDIKFPQLKDFLLKNFNQPILSFDLLVNYVCPACKAQEEANKS